MIEAWHKVDMCLMFKMRSIQCPYSLKGYCAPPVKSANITDHIVSSMSPKSSVCCFNDCLISPSFLFYKPGFLLMFLLNWCISLCIHQFVFTLLSNMWSSPLMPYKSPNWIKGFLLDTWRGLSISLISRDVHRLGHLSPLPDLIVRFRKPSRIIRQSEPEPLR